MFVFWYKKEIKANSIGEAIKKEKKVKLKFDSVKEYQDDNQELTPQIGFLVDKEYE